jgi:hypothetical protein
MSQLLGYNNESWAAALDTTILIALVTPGGMLGTQTVAGLGPNITHAIIGGIVYYYYNSYLQQKFMQAQQQTPQPKSMPLVSTFSGVSAEKFL